MSNYDITKTLTDVKDGTLSIEDAVAKLKIQPFEDLGFAKLDYHRKVRQGTSEVIFGEGKTPEQIITICNAMIKNGDKNILVTRLSEEKATEIQKSLTITYHKMGRIGIVGENNPITSSGNIIIATGGTSDMPVAEEAALTAEFLGNNVTRLYDVGVAGIHRLLAHTETIMNANVIIAIAGMEGALASVVGGLADCPVIGVPTSIGYGASFGGVSALLSMLNSCASGISVVNIDNGFGAGYLASMINKNSKESI